MSNDTFVFRKKWRDAIKDYDPHIKFEVYEAVILYATEGITSPLSTISAMAFNFIKSDIDKDQQNYEIRCEKNRLNGRKGGRPKTQSLSSVTPPTQSLSPEPNKPYNNSDSNNDSECKHKNDKHSITNGVSLTPTVQPSLSERQTQFLDSLKPYFSRYTEPLVMRFFAYWAEETQDKTRMKFELEPTWNTRSRLIRWVNSEKSPPQPHATTTYQTAAQRTRTDLQQGAEAIFAKRRSQ